ncbi:MAG TPA: hypothetical protein VN750_14780 [Steroidobacteraceae bacterium]|nr:hypothetical protein [Steroidobacteraceae bacterium]
MVRTLMLGLMLAAAAHAAAADATTPVLATAASDTTSPTPAVATSGTTTSAPAVGATTPALATATSDTAAPMPVAPNDMPTAPTLAAASAPATAPSGVAANQVTKRPTDTPRAGDGKAAASQSAQPGGDVKMSGMSILGNEDAPKSLVIVPWKSSQLAAMPSVSRLLDSTTQPVDKDVFMRELAYYEFKSGSK